MKMVGMVNGLGVLLLLILLMLCVSFVDNFLLNFVVLVIEGFL